MTSNSLDTSMPRLPSGVPNLDAIFFGGIPVGSVLILVGRPGTGKTILAEQICFHNATHDKPVLYFTTLSEPPAKTLRYLAQLRFFDASKLDDAMRFIDLGSILRLKGLESAAAFIAEQIKKAKPALVVIDSFKAFHDLAGSSDGLRRFGYGLAVNLMVWETTTLLLGEYGKADFEDNPIFSMVDGLCMLTQRQVAGEQRRFLQVLKMRGTDHSANHHEFAIGAEGLEIYTPRLTICRSPQVGGAAGRHRMTTGIDNLDTLLGEGIPLGSSLLVSGGAGTGKTVLLLEFIYRGALAGEKGILFSFEETEERLRATAQVLGWDLDSQIRRGMVEIVFIPLPEILVERHLLMIQARVSRMGATRIAIDSVSVFLQKVGDIQSSREKMYQLVSIVYNAHAVSLFASDIPHGLSAISQFGVKETIADGVILLTAAEEGARRQRYLEVYKLRNTAHVMGRHKMSIGANGIKVVPRVDPESPAESPAAAGQGGGRT